MRNINTDPLMLMSYYSLVTLNESRECFIENQVSVVCAIFVIGAVVTIRKIIFSKSIQDGCLTF